MTTPRKLIKSSAAPTRVSRRNFPLPPSPRGRGSGRPPGTDTRPAVSSSPAAPPQTPLSSLLHFQKINLPEKPGADVAHRLRHARPGPAAPSAGPRFAPGPRRLRSRGANAVTHSPRAPLPPRAPAPAREAPARAARRHPAQADLEVPGLSHTARPPWSASPHTAALTPDARAAGLPARPRRPSSLRHLLCSSSSP